MPMFQMPRHSSLESSASSTPAPQRLFPFVPQSHLPTLSSPAYHGAPGAAADAAAGAPQSVGTYARGRPLHDGSPYPGAGYPPSGPPAPTSSEGRPAWRDALCERAFSFVDSLQTGHLNMSQNKTGITMVFNWLGDVPMPKDSWFVKVFRNFAENDQGLIDYNNFKEIVTQWDEHHLRKKSMREQERAAAAVALAATPAAAVGQAAGGAAIEVPAPPPPPPAGGRSVPDLRAVEAAAAESQRQAQAHVQPLAPQATAPLGDQVQDDPLQVDVVQAPRELSAASTGSSSFSRAQPGSASATSPVAAPPSEGPPAQKPLGPATHARTRSEPAYAAASAAQRRDDGRGGACGGAGVSGAGAAAAQREEDVSPVRRARHTNSERTTAAEIDPEVMFPTYVGRLAIFDDYEFFGDVGSGAFGKVMVVRHRLTKQLRACKVVAVQTALQQELIDTEIRLLKSLNHPNIMKMHEVYLECATEQRVTNGNIYIVSELCEGGDLFSRILHHYQRLNKPMTESHVAFMMQQILSATHYCHDRGIIHRDIKPENILFVDRSSSSPLKIIDFGLANFTEKIRETAKEVKVPKTGSIGRLVRMLPSMPGGKHLIPWHERKRVMQRAGTAHYMAPEMIEGCYDQKADIFSIGIILCQLLTGWHPFYVQNVDDENMVRAKISSAEPVTFPPEIWKDVSAEALNLSKLLLEKRPENRPSAAKALAHPWFRDPSKPSAFGNVEALSVSIFDGLMKYQAYNKLKRAVLQLLTRELSEFQIQELRNKFMALDTQGDGLLSPEELVEGMRHVDYEMSSDELQKVVASLDGSGCQRIGYKEFISALIERRVKFDRQQLWECFKKFDSNDTGRISYEDVKSVVCPAITQSEWEEIAGQGTGAQKLELTFEEFVMLMENGVDS
eukprot:TRINITY_DN26907_c0_g1_i1.p1 TRINITY_DN26907_c0_g1~~TRINITY_DN26907_c0_g1_i1.p1  ORF type:complete len:917 (+),score=191.31 TRINITY_DN26907_c0_g1_i1:52-2751(+)